MTGIRIVRPEDRNLRPAREVVHWVPGSATASTVVEVISETEPYVHVAAAPPHHEIEPHSHSTPEVTVVLEGTMVVDGVACGPGTVAVIAADAPYGFVAGEEGVTFVVVRPARASFRAG